MSAETEGIVQNGGNRAFASCLGHVIEVALGIGLVQIDGWGDDAGFDGFQAGDHFDGSGTAEEVTGHGFGGTDPDFTSVIAEDGFDGLGFADIALGGGGSVGVDIGDAIWGGVGDFQSPFHGAGGSGPFRGWGGHVIGIGAETVAGDLAENFGSPFFSVFEFFQNQDAGPFAENKTVPASVKRAGGFFRSVIPGAERFHGAEARETEGNDGGFGTARDHDIGFTIADNFEAFADAIIGGGAGGHDGEIRALEAVMDGDQAGSHVADHHRNHEGRDAGGPFIAEEGVLVLEGLQATDP